MQGSNVMSWVAWFFGINAVVRGFLPAHYVQYLYSFLPKFSFFAEVVISKAIGWEENELFEHVQRYLTSITFHGASKSRAFLERNTCGITYPTAPNATVFDTFGGARMEWSHSIKEGKNGSGSGEDDEKYTLKMRRVHKNTLLEKYFRHIIEISEKIEQSNRGLRLYSNKFSWNGPKWQYVPFHHPASFDKIAMEPELKRSILEDLHNFTESGEFYRSIGKAWKRGYLLFGPPGTGKTSVVAAMANKLHYDVYNLELTDVKSNEDLRKLLVRTTGKSIIVIEDIDCSLDLTKTRKKTTKQKSDDKTPADDDPRPSSAKACPQKSEITLSGLLNFTDGLRSSSENERIFVFTTNHVEKLDPALLRSGRMDMHIRLGFCTFTAFKMLARIFLQVDDDERYPELEALFSDVSVSPSEVGEVLMRSRMNADLALDKVIDFLRDRKANPFPYSKPDQSTDQGDVANE